MDLQLRGKVALITGAGGGIGRETARLFAAEGMTVAAADVREETAAETLATVRQAGGTGITVALDVTDEASVAAAVRRAAAALGPLDVLVNCAGIYRIGGLADVSVDDWDTMMNINLRGTFLVCRAVLPGMIERGTGSVVNLSSISGRTKAILAAPSYVASKAGIIGLTMSLAAQAAAHGVRVNAVAPGPADTDMIRGLDAELQAHLVTTIPMGRLATAGEVAQAIAFLASSAAAFITGETLNVNGGAFMV
jgi:3-oxoacyl-[acyl-carrier protein] reductase